MELPSGIERPRVSSLGLFECPAAPLHKLHLPYKLQGSVQVQADGYLMIQKSMEIDVPLPHNLGRCVTVPDHTAIWVGVYPPSVHLSMCLDVDLVSFLGSFFRWCLFIRSKYIFNFNSSYLGSNHIFLIFNITSCLEKQTYIIL